MTDKELDDLFQNTFSNHRMPVPPGMWGRVNPQNNKRRRGAFLWRSMMGAAILMLAGTLVWLYHPAPKKAFAPATAHTESADISAAKKTAQPQQPAQAIPEPKQPAFEGNDAANYQQNKITGKIHSSIPFSGVETGNKQPAATSRRQGLLHNDSKTNLRSNSHLAKISYGAAAIVADHSAVDAVPSHTDEIEASVHASSVPPKKPDSTANTNSSLASQENKAPAIKVKKMHGEKILGLELMMAGYGNDRNIYAAKNENYITPFAEVNRKEKVLMQSAGITIRIDKPITPHLSFKTGLQYLRTRQRVSYGYEEVSQMPSISSFRNDTLLSARLQTRQTSLTGFYNSFSVPVLLSYRTNGPKISLGATAGVLVNVLSWYNGEVPGAGSYQLQAAKDVFRARTGASLYAGITASRQLGGFSLFAEPQVQYTLSSVTKHSAPFRQRIISYGIGIGIRKTIGK